MTAFRSTRKKVFLCMVAFAVLFFIFCSEDINYFLYFHNIRRNDSTTKQYVINTTGCRIPYLELEDEEIVSLYEDVSGYTCSKIPPLVQSNLTSLYVNSSVLADYGVDSIDEVKCFYTPFWRRAPTDPREDDVQVNYGKPVYFRGGVNVPHEFVKVECTCNRYKYKDYHSFVPLKPTVINTIRQDSDERLNVIIIGIDSLSRMHIHRKMPKTVRYFLEELNAIEYMGYNKVSDNTFPNLIPMLTSFGFYELVQKCWPNYNTRFDNCSFVWSNFTKQGYVTSFAEEQSSFGLFNFLKKGWSVQPTDYYWDTLDYTAIEDIGHWYDLYRLYPICMGPRPMYRVLLDNEEKFISVMAKEKRKFFTFSWDTSLTHNHIDTASLADQEYVDHIKFIKNTGVLNSSLLIFMSDHGYRFGKMAQTHQGHLEDRLPFIYWVFPDWFRLKYPAATKNIRENAYKLTNTYDIHATLNNILRLDELADEKINSAAIEDVRGISLFRPIPEERTCESAGNNDDSHVNQVARIALVGVFG